MKRTNTQTLSEILQEFFQENPLVAQKLAETRLINAWGKVLGHLTQKYTTGLYIKRKVLYVQLSSAVLRSELTLCRDRLVTNLNKEAGMEVIEDIVFTG